MPLVRPFPRLFPDVAAVVGGVVAEAGPQPLAAMPEHVSLYSADSELAIAELAVPALPRLLTVNGVAPTAGARVETISGIALSLGAAAGAIVELRPFGATVAVTCTVPDNASTGGERHHPARSSPACRHLLGHRGRAQRGRGVAGRGSGGARPGAPLGGEPASPSRCARRRRWSCGREPQPRRARHTKGTRASILELPVVVSDASNRVTGGILFDSADVSRAAPSCAPTSCSRSARCC